MKILTILVTLFAFPSLLWASEPSERDKQVTIKGEVVSRSDRNAVAFATIYLKDHKQYNCISDEQGVFELKAPLGQHTIIVSSVGFVGIEKLVDIDPSADLQLRFELDEQSLDADEVTVKGESASSRINKTAYNVQSITIDELKNTTASMTDVLSRMGGVNIREAGGLGSETVISINGFTGNHVKIFIDGVLLDGNNSSFTLSNIPANMAERIDLYSGVVPIEFGTDAIGGVINIITNKNLRQNSISLDASYSYGSFNTHSSYLNLSQVFKSGLTYSVNAYQNYSDNDYWIDNTVVKFTENPGWAPSADYSDKTVYRVQRFNDAYHNETAIAMIGVTNKSWADVLTLKVNYSQYHNQIQTGVVQDVVYGEKQRWGHSITPTLDFSKNDLFTSGLDLRFSANYSNGYTHNYDPATSSYSWSGESVTNSSLSQTDNELRNNSYNANLTAKYIMGESHEFVASNIFGSTSRIQRSIESGTTAYSDWDTPSKSLKNISGLSYRYQLSDRFDATAFGKYYWQLNEGVVLNSDGTTYSLTDRVNDQWGYGVAATYFITRGLQVKASFEKAYRLPTSTEIFGDGDR
ncbi:MAG: TonB-dependent receptor, partial [Rikenellaceae bacterium]